MNRNIFQIIFILLIINPFFLFGQNNSEQQHTSFLYQELSTQNPSAEASALYKYLQNISGEKMLSGQMIASERISEVDFIMNITLKKPAVLGYNIDHKNTVQNAIKWWNEGGIPLIIWNWETLNNSNFANINEAITIEKCLQEGTPENLAFIAEIKNKVDQLEMLRDASVPVLWSPFNSENGETFWWSNQGSEQFKKLWQTVFNYFTNERQLNNLIWVMVFPEEINREWFPGNSYVDIIGASSEHNTTDPQTELFSRIKTIANNIATPIANNKSEIILDPDKSKKSGAMWSWWLQRPGLYLTEIDQAYLNNVYNHNQIITFDELPDIVKDFSEETVRRYYYFGTTIPFENLKGYNLGIKSSNESINYNRLNIEAKGAGFQGTADEGYFTFEQIEGDFDISVKVVNLSPVHLYATAGIMARADLSRKSPHVFFHVFSNNSPKNNNSGGCELKYRTKNSKQTQVIYPASNITNSKHNVAFPDTWIRLKRSGNIFKSFISHDNINWNIYSVHTQEMPEKLLVGLAVSSGNNEISTTAEFEELLNTQD
ncbi:MAG: hypothetical protein JXR61_06150 [Prolixibacteraceae bacterium]|nr:hypothetical protein [Prolixibacteraceae bacterium]